MKRGQFLVSNTGKKRREGSHRVSSINSQTLHRQQESDGPLIRLRIGREQEGGICFLVSPGRQARLRKAQLLKDSEDR